MKDFDASRKHNHTPAEDRTFRLGGETFVAKEDVHPSTLIAFDRLDDANVETTLEIIDGTIESMLEGGLHAHELYRKVRADTEDPITLEVMVELARWLVEIQTGRPTGLTSVSEPGRTQTEASSTAGSSLLEATRATAA